MQRQSGQRVALRNLRDRQRNRAQCRAWQGRRAEALAAVMANKKGVVVCE